MDQLECSVAAILRSDSRVRGPALDVNAEGVRALAPHGQGVGGIARLEVQLHVGILEEFTDEGPRSRRAALFRRLHQEEDLREIPEAQLVQDLQRVDALNHTALLIGHAWSVGPLVVRTKRPALRGARFEHRIDMPDHENAGLATAD